MNTKQSVSQETRQAAITYLQNVRKDCANQLARDTTTLMITIEKHSQFDLSDATRLERTAQQLRALETIDGAICEFRNKELDTQALLSFVLRLVSPEASIRDWNGLRHVQPLNREVARQLMVILTD